MPLASPIVEPGFELKPVFFRRAWGMTAKVSALPDSRVAGVTHALRRGKKKRPETAGIKRLKKMAEQQAAYGEIETALVSQQNAPCQKHQPKNSSLAESPTAQPGRL